ncbi:TIGR03085 family metal-binding protein [Nocardioides sp.]|uniref:TIGR03085 family metal-binding protein n=1 Tax=Nocardioides sp. TaxID=35761 RepID=UPI002718D7C7|nr:TIGR03085 family metal-binding protein [Nocardioides sp.]MDO9455091.1 TIGR03085 family metal-binding protein [Nocardioides sp.]
MSPTLARRERRDLCDLALDLGPDVPTLCGGWDARQLLAHLYVREHRPLGGLGIAVPPLSRLTDQAMERAGREEFARLVGKVRTPGLTPFALRPVEVLANTLEYVVHHEDLRRAQAGWTPRVLDPDDLDAVWRSIRLAGRMLVRPAGVPVSIRRTDTDAVATLRGGEPSVVVSGPVVELVMFLYGRDRVTGLTFEGRDELVDRVRAADLGM